MSTLDKELAKKIKKYIEHDKYLKLKKLISQTGVSLNEVINKKGEKMLHIAAKEGATYCLEFLLKSGANAKLVDLKGNIPLHRALKYVIEDYNRDDESSLVSSLLTYSSCQLDVKNREGKTPRQLLKDLEVIKSKFDKKCSSASQYASCTAGSSGLQRTEDDEWNDKLAEEYEYEFEHSIGKFEKFTSVDEPSVETYDDWAERIYREFSSKRRKFSTTTKASSSKQKKSRSLKPESNIDLEAANRDYETLKNRRSLEKQKKLCDRLFKSNCAIEVATMPFRDLSAEEILEIILCDCAAEAADIKKRIREELLRWHPDKFRQKFGDRVSKNETEKVMDHVKHVSQILINYGK